MVKVSTDDFEEDVEVKLINTAGKLQSFVCAEKIKVDGVRTKIDFNVAKSLFYDNVETEVFDQNTSEVVTVSRYQLIPQVIGYTLNEEGNITGIDTKKYDEKNEEKYSGTYAFTANCLGAASKIPFPSASELPVSF